MGGVTSRRSRGVEEVDMTSNNAYRYPPKSGNYFGSHFIMGGERFETTPPETYLFGENHELNFLGNKPTPFPYAAPHANEPTKTLRSLVNIRKDSLRFVKVAEENGKDRENQKDTSPSYNIEFTFDTDVRCAITIYYFATEDISNKQLNYHPQDSSMNSETYHYKRGANQVFNQTSHIISPHKFTEDKWLYNSENPTLLPVVIHCVVEEQEYLGHSQATLAVVEKTSEGGYQLKPLKQKQMVDGLCYLLQEIYGIENKNIESNKEEDFDNSGSECVICMCELRDTIILPCRHLCLCNCCADNLRYQANNCPICRAPFRALLQIRAMKKKTGEVTTNNTTVNQNENTEEGCVSQLGVPAGFEAVSLIEALNGPAQSVLNPMLNTDGRSTVRSTGSNYSTGTPNVSPSLNKRKRVTRHGSRGSQCSRSSRLDLRGGGEDTVDNAGAVGSADDADRVATPEVCMTAIVLEPSKSPKVFPKSAPAVDKSSCSSLDCTDATLPLSEASVNIVNECQKLDEADRVKTAAEPPYPNPDYSASSDEETDSKTSPRPAAAHTAVFKSQDECSDKRIAMPIGIEPLSLPGTPANDDSSYSSTNSSHGLLQSANDPVTNSSQ